MNFQAKRWFELADRYSLSVGGASLLLCVAAGVWPAMRASFFNAWLFAWLFWLAISLGGMALTMMHHLTGGDWGDSDPPYYRLRRPGASGACSCCFCPSFLACQFYSRGLGLRNSPAIQFSCTPMRT